MLMGSNVYRPLSEAEVEQIHEASLSVLENTGFSVENERIRTLLKENGAVVEEGNDIVKIGRSIVERCIETAPSIIKLCGKTEAYDLTLGGDDVYIGTGGRPNLVIDLDTRERRPSTLKDVRDLVRLADQLDHIDFCVIPTEATDIPSEYVDVNNIFQALAHTKKHVMDGVSSEKNLKIAIDIAEKVAGGKEALKARPILSIITNVISPLKIDTEVGNILLTCAEYGLPIVCSTAPIAGITSPCTLEGSLVQQNAESLFGVVVTQLANPGTPYMYGASLSTINFKNMNFLFAGVEMGMMNACAAQMARWYKLPIYASAGPSDSKLADCQAGAEKAMNILMVAQAGGHYLHLAAGLLEGGLVASYEQLAIDNDILGAIKRTLRGYEFDEDHLALDTIDKVGPGGNYLAERHTLRHMRKEFFEPVVMNRDAFDTWIKKGGHECRESARLEARRLLDAEIEKYISDEVEEEIRNVYTDIIHEII